MASYTGLTWDHPRGFEALRAAADHLRQTGSDLEINWDTQPLEGFESRPIAELAERYDLIVLDHPHLGEAIADAALMPLDEIFDVAQMASWAERSVGRSYASYTMAGRQWALPLDAATQVSAYKSELVDSPPRTWAEVEALSQVAPVALSLAGPHALLTLFSLCWALEEASPTAAWRLTGSHALPRALELMQAITARRPERSAEQNPIAMLDRMRDTSEIAYCPLIYGYVTYASASMRFADVPAGHAGAPSGSVLGGTGIAISRRAELTRELVEHIGWLMSDEAQLHFIPEHAGQPSARAAWLDASVDERAAGFYSGTLATIEASQLRPREPGYIAVQSAASAVVRDVALGAINPDEGITKLGELVGMLAPAVGGTA